MTTKLCRLKTILMAAAILTMIVLIGFPGEASAQGSAPGPYTPNQYKSVSTLDGGFNPITDPTSAFKDDLVCDIINSSKVHCELHSARFVNCGNSTSCNKKDYYYNPVKSAQIGKDVFEAENSDGTSDSVKNKEWGYVVFPLGKTANSSNDSSGDYSYIILTQDWRKYSPGEALYDTIAGDDDNIKKAGESGICSVVVNKDGPVECTIGGQNKGGTATAIGKKVSASSQNGYKSGLKGFKENKGGDDCGGGGLDFILCPVKNLLQSTADTLSSWLMSILDVNTSGFQNADFMAANQRLLNLANAFYVLIFLIIIFANSFSIGLDSYALKKMVPRLVAAIILSQFAYLIAGAIVEVGNILGAGVQGFFSALGASGADGGAAQLTTALASVGAIFLVISMIVIAIVALIVVLGILALRMAMLYVLVLVAPLAFAAKVLPNTEKLFKTWWTNLIKLVMMYPIIVAIVYGSAAIGSIMKSDGNGTIIQIVGALLPFIGFLMVPKAFKWSGGLMAATGGKLGDWAAGKTKGAVKDSWSKEGGYKDRIDKATGGRAPTKLGPITDFSRQERLKRTGLAESRIKKEKEGWASGLSDDALMIEARTGKGKTQTVAKDMLKKKYSEELEKQEGRAAKGLPVDATKLIQLRSALGESETAPEREQRRVLEATTLGRGVDSYLAGKPAGTAAPTITYKQNPKEAASEVHYFGTAPGATPSPAVTTAAGPGGTRTVTGRLAPPAHAPRPSAHPVAVATAPVHDAVPPPTP